MTNFNDYLTQQMKDPAFKEAYEQLEPDFCDNSFCVIPADFRASIIA